MKKRYICPSTDVMEIKTCHLMTGSVSVKYYNNGSQSNENALSRGSSFDWEDEGPSRKDLWEDEEDYGF